MTEQYTHVFTPSKVTKYPTDSDYYSLAIHINIVNLSEFQDFAFRYVCKSKMAHTSDKIRINKNCITLLLGCAGDVNVTFEDVPKHISTHLLIRFTPKRIPNMTVGVHSQCQCWKFTLRYLMELFRKQAESWVLKLTSIFQILTLSKTCDLKKTISCVTGFDMQATLSIKQNVRKD